MRGPSDDDTVSPVAGLVYGDRWNDWTGAMVRPLSPRAARARDARGALYSVMLANPFSRPTVVLSVRWETGWVGVTRLDELGRNERSWGFDLQADGHLLLNDRRRYFYDASWDPHSGRGITVENLYFDPDGRYGGDRIAPDNTATALPFRWLDDPSVLREPRPAFGEWLSVLRYGRDKPLEAQPAWWLAVMRASGLLPG